MPCEYWPIIRANRWLLGEMNRLAADVILTICRDLNITPGVFTAIHTWGRDRSKASWNQLLNTHHMRGWNINLSDILSNITHVTLYLGFYLNNPLPRSVA
ncbi:hypothetical protein [Candidatus Arsenophonus triatominarum]|uniref:hypothetical protein n=1 Tax=Candidatus Arsenophonus triatominarum TaxID=57911 RepID=UPI003CCBF066